MAFLKLAMVALLFTALAWEKSKVQAKNLPSESAASRMLKRASIDIARRICPKDGTLLEDKLNQSFTCIERIDEDMILVCDVLIEADNCVKPVLEAIDRCGAPAEKEVYSHSLNSLLDEFKKRPTRSVRLVCPNL
ncbi:uncharacterized protein LOC125504646 isoform X2 [Dendroctonus ponderosae]